MRSSLAQGYQLLTASVLASGSSLITVMMVTISGMAVLAAASVTGDTLLITLMPPMSYLVTLVISQKNGR